MNVASFFISTHDLIHYLKLCKALVVCLVSPQVDHHFLSFFLLRIWMRMFFSRLRQLLAILVKHKLDGVKRLFQLASLDAKSAILRNGEMWHYVIDTDSWNGRLRWKWRAALGSCIVSARPLAEKPDPPAQRAVLWLLCWTNRWRWERNHKGWALWVISRSFPDIIFSHCGWHCWEQSDGSPGELFGFVCLVFFKII